MSFLVHDGKNALDNPSFHQLATIRQIHLVRMKALLESPPYQPQLWYNFIQFSLVIIQ